MDNFKSAAGTRTLLIGANCARAVTYNSSSESLRELCGLVSTAGGEVICSLVQQRDAPDPATFIGEGKVLEAKELVQANDIDLIVFDGELSPSQLKNLEAETDCFVIDRSMLILDIFALHAVTSEGKLQVELAQLRYTLPRLSGKGVELSRLGGGIGTRGPGESKLETDRRHIRTRIAALRSELLEVKKNRGERRALRDRKGCPRVAIVGYTNAGKSTLLNYLTGAGVLTENKLFATLDPTTRALRLPSGMEIFLTDTVGLIRNLPHQFIEAFSSTLDELKYSDLLLHIVDASNPDCLSQIEVTNELICDLSAGDKPIITALNKCDKAEDMPFVTDGVRISAATGEGVPELLQKIEETLRLHLRSCTLMLPFEAGALLSKLHSAAHIENEEYVENGVLVTLHADETLYNQIKEYII